MSEDGEPNPAADDSEPANVGSTPLGTIYMPVDPHVPETVDALERMARNRSKANRALAEEQAEIAELRRLQLAAARGRQGGGQRKRGRSSRDTYDGRSVELAVKLLPTREELPAARKTGNWGRNAAAKKADLSTWAIDMVVAKIEAGKLARADRKGRLVIRGELTTTPRFINLRDL